VARQQDTPRRQRQAARAAFGAENRNALIDDYFAQPGSEPVSASTAWRHVYRLLLWIDQTTGLAHCYESDKSQPGKHWYARSLAFHDWVSGALGVQPADLAMAIDWLFQRVAEDLAREVLRKADAVAKRAMQQRLPYEGRGFPRPGDDPELVALVTEILGPYLGADPPRQVWDELVQRVRQHFALDNKRKNLVGEGFEDVLAHIIKRACPSPRYEVATRTALHDLPGFNRVRAGDKPNKVDVAVIRPAMRTLITAKWSVRADREKQFITDFADYVMAESHREPFEYVFVTNEFDPARLARACEQLSGNAPMFRHVVHINTAALSAAYGATTSDGEAASAQKVLRYIADGRLLSLGQWLSLLADS
jgi:hypothetical protein